jgi:uncharacterized membrane-anchored protein
MQDRHVPYLAAHYWVALGVASVAGANSGDLVAEYLGIGHVRGLPVLGLALAVILLVERHDRAIHTSWYWLAVVVIRMAATNLADFLTVDLHLGRPLTLAGLGVLLFAIFPMARSEARLLMASVLMARPRKGARPMTDAGYWSALIVASTLGSVLGDWCTIGLDLGSARSSLLLVILAATAFMLQITGWISRLRLYWITIVLLLAAGTTIADLMARDPNLKLGLPLATLISIGGMVFIVGLWRGRTSEPAAF